MFTIRDNGTNIPELFLVPLPSLLSGFSMVTPICPPTPSVIYTAVVRLFLSCNSDWVNFLSICPTPQTHSFLPKFNSFPPFFERKDLTKMNSKDLYVWFLLPALQSLWCPCPYPQMHSDPLWHSLCAGCTLGLECSLHALLTLVTSHTTAPGPFPQEIFLDWED